MSHLPSLGFGFSISPYNRFRHVAELVEVVQLGEALGFDAVMLREHDSVEAERLPQLHDLHQFRDVPEAVVRRDAEPKSQRRQVTHASSYDSRTESVLHPRKHESVVLPSGARNLG